jgi:hypothetical protein
MHITKLATTAAVTALLIATTTAAAASPDTTIASGHPATSCTSRWSLLQASSLSRSWPNPYGDILSVSALSPHDAWFGGIKGYFGPPGSTNAGAWQWNGRSVAEPKKIPQIPLSPVMFGGTNGGPAAFDSDSDGWELTAQSSFADMGFWGFGTAERWHGGRWTLTPLALSPHPATVGVEVTDVAALSSANAWAVGGFFQAGRGIVAGGGPIGALIEHWNGTTWKVVPNPAAARNVTSLRGLTAVSPTDIWAVGYQTGLSSGSFVPLVEHWNGKKWSIVPVPAGNQNSLLDSVTSAAGQLWVAGDQTKRGTANTAVPLIEHWNGKTWTVQRLPHIGNSEVDAIYAASTGDVWAGLAFGAFSGSKDVLLHWNGHAWTAVPIPAPQAWGIFYQITAIGGTGPTDVWAAGVVVDGGPYLSPLLMHLSCV